MIFSESSTFYVFQAQDSMRKRRAISQLVASILLKVRVLYSKMLLLCDLRTWRTRLRGGGVGYGPSCLLTVGCYFYFGFTFEDRHSSITRADGRSTTPPRALHALNPGRARHAPPLSQTKLGIRCVAHVKCRSLTLLSHCALSTLAIQSRTLSNRERAPPLLRHSLCALSPRKNSNYFSVCVASIGSSLTTR